MAQPVFEKVPSELNFPREERATLEFWKRERIFEQSLTLREGAPTFVFYEGPPTANGLPHNGHVLTRVIKDLFPRYKTMRGYQVPRKAGWDTHGLPVEVEVEKELRIHGKAAIEEYGVEPFIARCVQSVFRYTSEWEHLTERVGFWVDLPSAYVTYHQSYVESVWWALSELYKKGLLYQGHKVVWWWAQGGTALSSGEVGLGYKEVLDPSAYVAFPLATEALGAGASLLIWTTTPWTLPSNMFVAVNASFDYAVVLHEGRRLVVAEKLVAALAKKLKGELTVEKQVKGSDLVGLAYEPPFAGDYAGARELNVDRAFWRVLATDFVSLDAGTGLVHVAPAFGEDDHRAYSRENSARAGRGESLIPLLCAVAPDGTFNDRMPRYLGRWVKDCDKDLTAELKARGALLLVEQYKHDYPFCWRSDTDPLIQYARPAWYIRTTALKDAAIANNRAVEWLPDHIKEGRFGDFLAHNVDWALSRERYWGTPLNIWVCDKTKGQEGEHRYAPPGTKDILAKNPRAFDHFHAARKADPTLSEHLVVHKPWIDDVTFACTEPGCDGVMRRVPEVIDCWFDSGCMPFAQWGFPHQGHAEFTRSFPADFISEAIDQTRGWFYSLLMISTLVFDEETQTRVGLSPVRATPHPYKTCIVLGHVSDKEGKKESKSKGNYTPPEIILDAVQMDFAVLARADAEKLKGVAWKDDAAAWIAVEDLDGLDLTDGASVVLRGPAGETDVALRGKKGLPRRVIVLDESLHAKLGVTATRTPDVKPVEVPRLAVAERVTVVDPSTPAPGADAFRWFFYASGPPWNATRHSLSNVRALQKEFLVKLRNVYSFFTIYADLDGYDPTETRAPAPEARAELDRWILVELAETVKTARERLDAYDIYSAALALTDLVDALSNWYVRRSRARFWSSGWTDDKASAYATLYEVLVTLSKLIAPFVPFFAEAMYQNLVLGPARAHGLTGKAEAPPASVHLTTYPEPDARWQADASSRALSPKVRAVRELVSLGLQVRTQAKAKVRQPLRNAYAVVVDTSLFEGSAVQQLTEELNVLVFHPVPLARAGEFVEFRVKPNFRALGSRGIGKEAQALKASMAKLSPVEAATFAATILGGKSTTHGGVELSRADVEVELVAREGFAAAGDRVGVVVLDTKLDAELIDLGLVRELQSRVQGARKEMELGYADRIQLFVDTEPRLRDVLAQHHVALAAEVLATEVVLGPLPTAGDVHVIQATVEGMPVSLGIRRA